MDNTQKLFGELSSDIEDGVKSSIDETAKSTDETKDDATNTFVEILYTIKEGVEKLKEKLGGVLGTVGDWMEEAGEPVVRVFEPAVRQGRRMTLAVQGAYDRVCEVAKDVGLFIRDHPFFCTLVVLGILALLTPLIIEALGFAATGPVAGKCMVLQYDHSLTMSRLLRCRMAVYPRGCCAGWLALLVLPKLGYDRIYLSSLSVKAGLSDACWSVGMQSRC
jgi:hypothetical protein